MDSKCNIRLPSLLLMVLVVQFLSAQNPNWVAPTSSDYSFTASAVTAIYLNGMKSDNAGDRIAFFVDNELRGLSTPVDLGGQQYLHFVTIYSNTSTEVMSIKVYHQSTDIVYEVGTPLEFVSQQIYGSVDVPMELNVYDDNDAPIHINTVPFQVTLEGLPFGAIDMVDYLVQPDNQGVEWTYTPNPNLIVNLTGSILSVEGAPNFTGYTTLDVKATELPMTISFANFRGNNNASRTQIAHYAEVTIGYYVTPGYLGPLWITIPSQGIVKGGQFTDVNVHEYENQYGGPAIQYDYIPLIAEAETPIPKPSWTHTGNYQTNMSIVGRVDYTPKYQFHHKDDILAAYVDDEIRGIATLDELSGLYFISVGGSATEMDSVTIKFYSGAMKKEFELEHKFIYESHQIIGSVDEPYLLEMAPIVPEIIDYPIAGGYMVMPVNVVDTSYIGTEYFRFYAYDPNYPYYMIDSTETSFCIVSVISELTMLYADADGDGLGDPNVFITSCSTSPGYVTNGDDCDDTNPEDITITITIMENSAGIANDDFVCANDNATLTVTGGTDYEWSTGETTATIDVMPSYASEYRVTATTGAGCKGVKMADLEVEGKVVTSTANAGKGSLRSVLMCLIEGDTITYDQPTIMHSDITESIVIDKEVNIMGQSMTMRPEIRLDYTAMTQGFEVLMNKNLNIENIDFKVINGGTNPILIGEGMLNILGITEVKQ